MKSEDKERLDIEIPEDIKDQISTFRITSELETIIEINGNTVIAGIEFKKIKKKQMLDWEKTNKKIMSKLKELGIDYKILTKIHILLTTTRDKIIDFVGIVTNQNNEEDDDLKFKPIIKISKYYSEKEQRVYENVILEGVPCFISYYENEGDDLIVVEKIEEDTRILIPHDVEDSPAKPFEFANKDHLIDVIRKSKSHEISQLYKECKRIISKYIDQKSNIITVIAVDIIFSYFQDRYPTTHYLLFVGKTNVGKTAIGDIIEQLCYRGAKMTDPSVANIYRLLGKIEPAQFTMILDEANDIDNEKDKMNVLKTGYTINGRVPKINTHNNNIQEFFKTYGFKVFLAENLPSSHKAQGLLDRTFTITCLPGNPLFSIRDIVDTQGKVTERYRELRKEINQLRQSLFVYRLIHSNDERPDIDTGLRNRDKELVECITLFYGSDIQQEVEETFQELLDSKYEQKENSFDSKLLLLILSNLENSEAYGEISVEDLWNSIKNTMNCQEVNTNEIFLVDFGYTLHRNQLSNKCQIFGGKSKHTNKGNKIIFNDVDKLRQIYDSYSTENRPVIRSSIRNFKDEGSEGSEGSGGQPEEFIDDGRRSKQDDKDGYSIEQLPHIPSNET